MHLRGQGKPQLDQTKLVEKLVPGCKWNLKSPDPGEGVQDNVLNVNAVSEEYDVGEDPKGEEKVELFL